ncbi:MAG: cysteine--tRNA ligase [Allgaiera sp.]|jgi:cysteinyl-tRNA synthetase|nr:cysteine--tRNA ligase [Allgaiera sp.]
MVEIRLHNTKTRRKECFDPIDPDNVRIYVCGPTVYDRAHLGNARPVVVFDTLFRLMRHVYGADHVTYVRNFTDVDDKINARAAKLAEAGDRRPLEEIIHALTDETIGWYHADMDALGALRPTKEPRATEWIGAMVTMISDLIAKGHAYEKAGHILFRVRSYQGYGALSGRSVDDMIAGARVEVAPFKEDPMDFVLWKPSSDDLPGWDSPWGRGRPGWHIECSAMSYELLGASFDIHGGGIDLQFPHHENELAQSCCAHPEAGFAKVWMHNEMLQVEGKKMSKSLGNFFTVRDLLEQGVPGEVIRFVFLGTHYTKPMDWTAEKAAQAKATLAKWYRATNGIASAAIPREVVEALADDLNGHMALVHMHDYFKRDMLPELRAALEFIGFGTAEEKAWWRDAPVVFGFSAAPGVSYLPSPAVQSWVSHYERLCADRNFADADPIRKVFVTFGFEVRREKQGGVAMHATVEFDVNDLEAALESLK